jgi:hypothetical protein
MIMKEFFSKLLYKPTVDQMEGEDMKSLTWSHPIKILLFISFLLIISAVGCSNPSEVSPASTVAPDQSLPEITNTPTLEEIVPTDTVTPQPTPMPKDQVWFAPNMGSIDYPRLFTHPVEWEQAKSKIDVFMFYPQLIEEPCSECGENTYERLVLVGAFQKLSEAGIAIAIEAGAVKEWGCTADRTFEITQAMIRKVAYNGGKVSIIAMDEPLIGGELEFMGLTCAYEWEQSAVQTASYIKKVQTEYPHISIGDIEPYPHYSIAELEQWILLVLAEGVELDFFHLDIDIERVRVERSNIKEDLQEINRFCEEHHIPLGIIITSNWTKANTDKAYYDSTIAWIETIKDAIGKPAHLIFQSWHGPAPSGNREVPINLPEDDLNIFSHTRLLLEGLTLFME